MLVQPESIDISHNKSNIVFLTILSCSFITIIIILHQVSFVETFDKLELLEKISVVILVINSLLEFIRGYLHWFFPIASHNTVSRLVDTFKIRNDPNAITPLYLVTYQFGCANILLGFFYLIPLFNDNINIEQLLFIHIITAIIRSIQELDKILPITTNLFKIVQQHFKDENPYIPPGKLVQNLQLPIVWIGVIVTLIQFRKY